MKGVPSSHILASILCVDVPKRAFILYTAHGQVSTCVYTPFYLSQDWPKSHNDEENKLHKKMDESVQRKEHRKAKVNHENARTHTTCKTKREHHSSYGRKEVPGHVHSLPKGRESDKHISRASNRYLDDKPPVNDTKEDITVKYGQKNEPKIIASVSEEKSDDKTPWPSYNKSRPCIPKITLTGSTGEAQGHKDMNQRGVKIAKEEDGCVTDAIKKPKPESVRTRLREENSDTRFRHGIKIASDEEEKMMDRLLMHYTRKQAQDGVRTLAEVECSEVSRKRSIRIELKQETPTVTLREGHTEATNLFEDDDMLSPNGHIHSKLPDYDDFVRQLAALKAK